MLLGVVNAPGLIKQIFVVKVFLSYTPRCSTWFETLGNRRHWESGGRGFTQTNTHKTDSSIRQSGARPKGNLTPTSRTLWNFWVPCCKKIVWQPSQCHIYSRQSELHASLLNPIELVWFLLTLYTLYALCCCFVPVPPQNGQQLRQLVSDQRSGSAEMPQRDVEDTCDTAHFQPSKRVWASLAIDWCLGCWGSLCQMGDDFFFTWFGHGFILPENSVPRALHW